MERKQAGREEGAGLEEEAGGRLGNLEQVFVELGVQHGHFRLDIFVQNQRKHRKHGIDGGVPARKKVPSAKSQPVDTSQVPPASGDQLHRSIEQPCTERLEHAGAGVKPWRCEMQSRQNRLPSERSRAGSQKTNSVNRAARWR